MSLTLQRNPHRFVITSSLSLLFMMSWSCCDALKSQPCLTRIKVVAYWGLLEDAHNGKVVQLAGSPVTSVQKIEAGLQHARLNVRKAFVLGNRKMEVSPKNLLEGEPSGDVYINAVTFRQ